MRPSRVSSISATRFSILLRDGPIAALHRTIMTGKTFRTFSAIALGMATFVMAATPADARRGGSFGSRGARTAVSPPTTTTAPNQATPVQRTMTERQPAASAARNPAAAAGARPAARSGGFARGLIGGLVAGGLVAMLMGGGFGALAGSGMLMALLQIALIGGLVWLGFRMFRRRPTLAAAGAPGMAPRGTGPFGGMQPTTGFGRTAYESGNPQAGSYAPAPAYEPVATQDFAVTTADKQAFENLLGEVQDAFSREDYTALRAITTPEVMSYLAEELSQNATSGQRNDVSGTELLEAEIAEAWSEDDADYATVAMQYHSIDVMRDRTTGAIVKGDPTQLTRTTELWTFVRDSRNPWRLSAIQEA